MSRAKHAVKSSRDHPKDASLDTRKAPRAPKKETRDAPDTPDPRRGDFALIFMRVKLKNDDSAAEWRGRHSSTTTPAHKNDWKKCYHNNGASPGSTVFYVDETIGFDKNRCHSRTEWGGRPPGVPTIIIYKETITFNNNNNNHFVQRTTGLHPSGELFTAGAPTPTSLGELLLINGIIDQPNPSYPALCLQDTTHSWSSDDQATNSCMPLLQQWYIPPVPRGTPVPGGARLIRTTCGLWDPAHTYHLCLVGPESTPGGAQAGNY